MKNACELTILMPCLNEAESIGGCIDEAKAFLARLRVDGEVLVADNDSTDDSAAIALAHGARVARVEERGYGAAVLGGIDAARGRYVVIADADGSYDLSRLDAFVERLRQGDELVMGNRFRGAILPGAMPPLHRYFGNPALSGIGRLFFGRQCGDFHCGVRGFDKAAIDRLDLHTTGMELASEMVVKAMLHGLKISEVPTTLRPAARGRPPHLRSWRDGWRHLRFLLVYSPRWLFLYPGLGLTILGLALFLWILPKTRHIGSVGFDIHTLVYAAGMVLLGLQAAMFAVFTKAFCVNARLLPPDDRFGRILRAFSLERGLVVGVSLIAAGALGSAYAVVHWQDAAFGPQEPEELMRIVIPAVTCVLSGMQIVFASFFLSILQLQRRGRSERR